MGQYNPHAPYILGQEWVPIRNAFYVSDGVTERGYSFRLDATTVPVSGAFYVQEIPGNRLASACDFISVYPSGRETLTGPVKKVRAPASAIAVNNPGSIDISEGVAALLSPEDGESIIFTADGIGSQLRVSFDTSPLAEILLGKRILDVRIRYQFTSFDLSNAANFSININDTSLSSMGFPQVVEMTGTSDISRISVLSVTEMNPFWNTAVSARAQRDILPWRFQELNRFRSGASPALVVSIQNEAVGSDVFLGFIELEIVYCEETRVLYGGFRTYDLTISNTPALLAEFYHTGAIPTRLYNPATFTPGNTLPAGEYVVTLYHRDMASRSVLQGAPRLHALREYYQLPTQKGVEVRQTVVEDSQFTRDDTDVLTQVTLHTATQIVTGVHPYGTQYGAPVYGSRTVTQEIEDNPSSGTGVRYPQVRFYARRYGNTTVPLTLSDVATGVSTVSISVAEFDALPEIVDGWREVTLRFATPPTFPVTADDVDWRWSATSELTGNQWQIMVADGPSGSWNPVPAAAATGPATYWAPLGASVGLTWQSPSISGSAFDSTSDAVLIFSQDPPAVTGFGLAIQQQELDVAVQCSTTPRCVPSALSYVRATWGYGTGCADELDITLAALSSDTGTTYDLVPNQRDVVIRGTYHNMVMPTGGNFEVKIAVRYVDGSNFVETRLFLGTAGTVSASVRQVVAGVETNGGFPSVSNITSVDEVAFIFSVVGTSLRFKAWKTADPEPIAWTATLTTSFVTPGDVRLAGQLDGTVTNTLPVMYEFRDVIAAPPAAENTYLELQRLDAYADDWQTIMLSTTPCPNSFNDYEARIGVPTSYRIRTLNALDFAGPWVTGSATIPAPGVTIGGTANSLLTFTSNEQPDSNLAYVMQFEGTPIEQFAFPEADTVSLQRLFDRDFFIAVRPLERGGDRFSRTILVNAAAIALPSLANFTGLRDLAWADVSYVCVRDELGNRWFATVIVPEGTVRSDRTVYLARIDVIQVTNIPSQVE